MGRGYEAASGSRSVATMYIVLEKDEKYGFNVASGSRSVATVCTQDNGQSELAFRCRKRQ